jgi:hypothetical protein
MCALNSPRYKKTLIHVLAARCSISRIELGYQYIDGFARVAHLQFNGGLSGAGAQDSSV